ncbi:MAG: hypothetical protein K2X03_15760 [Bryobacteraceae bacterium]|nr:hypothetical protein [Bryobacteraceae bacterium]
MLTLELLTDAAATIAADGGISEDCWNNALSRITGADARISLERVRNQADRAARTGPRYFFNGLTASATNQDPFERYVHSQMLNLATYAVAAVGFPEIWWRPGSTVKPSSLKWLLGALLHELLHNVGFSDNELQDSFGLPRSDNTDNISDFLQQNCFPVAPLTGLRGRT